MSAEAAVKINDQRDELIGGRIVLMSPSPNLHHVRIAKNIFSILNAYVEGVKGSKCEVFTDGFDVHLTKTDRYEPDCMVVCDPDKVKFDGIHGAPDLVVEVLSPSTAKYDRAEKKDVYEACGVREYWIVNPVDRSVEQYLLNGGRFELNEVYMLYADYMIEGWSEEKKAEIVTEFKCSLSDELVIRLEDVFARVG